MEQAMWIPIHKNLEPGLLRVFSWMWLWIILFVAALLTGVALSISASDWDWLARMGSIATISGLLLIMRPIFRQGLYPREEEESDVTAVTVPGAGTFSYFNSEAVLDRHAAVLGTVFTVVGTLIWAFGGLLG